MSNPANTSLRDRVSPEEWQQRVNLAAAYRLVAHFRWDDLVFTHLSAREDAKCVLHVHSLNGIAVSAQPKGVLPISQQSIFVLSSLAYHDYEGVALRDDEKPRLVRDLGAKSFLMLRNHGLITVGDNIPDAFLLLYLFESACAIQVRATQAGGELIHVDPRIIATAQAQAQAVTRGLGGALAWPGLLRRLDRLDATYKD